MLKILVKKQLTEIFRSYFYNPKTNKARSKGAVAGYIILFAVVMVGLLGGMFTMMSLGLCGPLVSAGMGMAVLRADEPAGGAAGRLRQRVQYLFGAVSG